MRAAPAVINVFDDPEPSTTIYIADCGSAKMEMTYQEVSLTSGGTVDVVGPTISQVINDKTFVHTVFVFKWAGDATGGQTMHIDADMYVDGLIMNRGDTFDSTFGPDAFYYTWKETPYIALVDEGVGIHSYSWRLHNQTSPIIPVTAMVRQTVWSVCTTSPRTIWHEDSGSG